MFTPNEWQSLVMAMQNRTIEGDLKWVPGKPEASFQAHLNKDTVAVLRSVDGDGQPPFELTIYRPGTEEDGVKKKWTRFGSVDSQEMTTVGWQGSGDQLQQLHLSITRIANEVDEVFKSIMDALSSD